MKTMTRLSGGLLVVGVLTALGGQAQATGLPACMQAEADLEADEVRVEGNFRSCSKPSVWLGQAGGSYLNLGAPLEKSNVSLVADLSGATVVEGTTQKVVVKCGKAPRCEIDVAFVKDCEDCVGPPAPVEKTGQTTSYATGDETCDGTVTDNLTGLIWLTNANCPNATRDWATALSDVAQLNTNGTMNSNDCGDNSNSGNHQTDWRLPNIKELQSLVHYGVVDPALPNTAGTGQWTANNPFSGVQRGYWSSTSYAVNTSNAWYLDLFYGGAVSNVDKTFTEVDPMSRQFFAEFKVLTLRS